MLRGGGRNGGRIPIFTHHSGGFPLPAAAAILSRSGEKTIPLIRGVNSNVKSPPPLSPVRNHRPPLSRARALTLSRPLSRIRPRASARQGDATSKRNVPEAARPCVERPGLNWRMKTIDGWVDGGRSSSPILPSRSGAQGFQPARRPCARRIKAGRRESRDAPALLILVTNMVKGFTRTLRSWKNSIRATGIYQCRPTIVGP
ncbi:uncharacterized protein [Narcine bancroftii]|uniref:uncharacterized protein isoform X2 n=1 Tax=Narcine bancroftii TaxID=1343680 RepID=UPI0038310A7B